MQHLRTAFIRHLKRHAATYWGLFIALCVLVEYLLFAKDISFREHSSRTMNLMRLTADIAFLLLPYWFIPRKARFSILFLVWGISIFFFTNSLYYEFFKDLFPFSLISQTANTNGLLIRSVVSLIQFKYLVYLLVPIAITAAWCMRPIRSSILGEQFGNRRKIAYIALSMLLFLGMQWKNSTSYSLELKLYGKSTISFNDITFKRIHRMHITERHKLEIKGLPLYVATEFFRLLTNKNTYRLNNVQRESLDDFINRGDTEIVKNRMGRGNNLIIMIVESLNADIIGTRVNGRPVTPTLDSIINSDNTLSCLNVTSQVSVGTSSDGQLMYNLGVLPLKKEVATQNYLYQDTLPALPRLLSDKGYSNVAIFADDAHSWNQYKSYLAYGYDNIFTIKDILGDKTLNEIKTDVDNYTMSFAENYLDSLPQPFFMEFITIGMHHPFGEGARGDFATEKDIPDKLERRYTNAVHMLDNAINSLMKTLRQKNLDKNTTVVIASDHCMNTAGGVFPVKPIAFIAYNCGYSGRIERTVGQVDIFPTLLDFFYPDSPWRGVGTSLLRGAAGAIDSKGTLHSDGDLSQQQTAALSRQWTVSDSILHSDYFRK